MIASQLTRLFFKPILVKMFCLFLKHKYQSDGPKQHILNKIGLKDVYDYGGKSIA